MEMGYGLWSPSLAVTGDWRSSGARRIKTPGSGEEQAEKKWKLRSRWVRGLLDSPSQVTPVADTKP